MQVSVCVPSRGPVLGLWATLTSARMEWPGCELIVTRNGVERDGHLYLLEKHGTKVIWSQAPLHPATARDVAAAHATGDVLVFLDDHVLVPRDVPLPERGLAHYAYTTYPGFPDTYYHFLPGPELPTKGDYAKQPLHPHPYPCGSGSHGMFACPTADWRVLGGYSGNWQGFGGEEAYLGLKAARLGLPVVLYPDCTYHHFSARSDLRGYDKTILESNYRYGMELLNALSSRPVADPVADLEVKCHETAQPGRNVEGPA